MLREIEGVTDEPRTRRRWFHDDYFDLFLWQTEEGDVTLFQLCYGTGSSERALVWHREVGFFHDGTGPDQRAGNAKSATGAATGKSAPPAEPIIARFEAAAQSLPSKVRRVVSQRVREYLEGRITASSRRKRFRREKWQDVPVPRPGRDATQPRRSDK